MYSRAYTAIIDYLIAFGVGRSETGHGVKYYRASSSIGFVPQYLAEPEIGDLVRLESMRTPEYRLGWLIDKRELRPGYEEWCIRSAKTGNECWWGNVGISALHRGTTRDFPSWKWTDDQYAFDDLFDLACKADDPYIYLPFVEGFEGDDAYITMRLRYGISDKRYHATVRNWKKYVDKKKGFPRKALLEVYRSLVAEAKADRAKKE